MTMQIELKPFEPRDLKQLLDWIETYEQMVQWSGPWNFKFPLNESQLARVFLTDTTPDGLRRMQFKAVDVESQTILGQVGFSRIWDTTSAAHLGPVIVAPSQRGQGIGLLMIRQLLKIGFEQQQLHRIELVVFSFNQAAISCYERAGFQTEGVMRDIVRVDGEYWHWTVMSVLRDEWQQ